MLHRFFETVVERGVTMPDSSLFAVDQVRQSWTKSDSALRFAGSVRKQNAEA